LKTHSKTAIITYEQCYWFLSGGQGQSKVKVRIVHAAWKNNKVMGNTVFRTGKLETGWVRRLHTTLHKTATLKLVYTTSSFCDQTSLFYIFILTHCNIQHLILFRSREHYWTLVLNNSNIQTAYIFEAMDFKLFWSEWHCKLHMNICVLDAGNICSHVKKQWQSLNRK